MNDCHKAALVVYPKKPGELPRKVDLMLALEKLRLASKGAFDFAVPFSSDGTWIVEIKL